MNGRFFSPYNPQPGQDWHTTGFDFALVKNQLGQVSLHRYHSDGTHVRSMMVSQSWDAPNPVTHNAAGHLTFTPEFIAKSQQVWDPTGVGQLVHPITLDGNTILELLLALAVAKGELKSKPLNQFKPRDVVFACFPSDYRSLSMFGVIQDAVAEGYPEGTAVYLRLDEAGDSQEYYPEFSQVGVGLDDVLVYLNWLGLDNI